MDNRFYFGFNTSEERKKRRKAELYSMSEQVSTFFWDEAPQHGLEMREGQQDMSFEIVDALINDQHFAIEAGVGIGKSFGYLVPVLLYSKRMNKPVIIATSTIALQEQLWRDVHTVMPLLGLNRDVILAKGQTHYLCNKRADEYMCDPKADPPDALKEGIQQLHRNFDLAVSQADYPEIFAMAKSESEGIRMVKATAAYLISQRKPYLIPVLGMRSASKLLGYRLGRSYQKLPENIVLHLTGNKSYWEKKKKLQSRCKN